jgi:DNA-directed RNA polymerase specialized sigma24 family protein
MTSTLEKKELSDLTDKVGKHIKSVSSRFCDWSFSDDHRDTAQDLFLWAYKHKGKFNNINEGDDLSNLHKHILKIVAIDRLRSNKRKSSRNKGHDIQLNTKSDDTDETSDNNNHQDDANDWTSELGQEPAPSLTPEQADATEAMVRKIIYRKAIAVVNNFEHPMRQVMLDFMDGVSDSMTASTLKIKPARVRYVRMQAINIIRNQLQLAP